MWARAPAPGDGEPSHPLRQLQNPAPGSPEPEQGRRGRDKVLPPSWGPGQTAGHSVEGEEAFCRRGQDHPGRPRSRVGLHSRRGAQSILGEEALGGALRPPKLVPS